MAKKSEINKKGRLAKSTLSVVLAASMVLTSSSFVWAAPVEDIAIVEEGDAAVEAVEVPVEEAVGTNVDEVSEASVEENVGIALENPVAECATEVTYNGSAQTPVTAVKTEINGEIIPSSAYTVTYENNKDVSTEQSKATYTVKFKDGTKYEGTGDITGEFEIDPLEVTSDNTTVEFKSYDGIFYTGEVQTPEAVVKTVIAGTSYTLPATDYKLVSLDATSYDLTSVGTQKAKLAAASSNITIAEEESVESPEYIIDPSDFNESTVTVTSKPVPFPDPSQQGSRAEADVTVKNKTTDDELVKNDDYTLQYYNAGGQKVGSAPQDIGKYRLDVIGKGNYRGDTIQTTYEVVKELSLQQIIDAEIGEEYYEFTYNFKEQGFSEEILDCLPPEIKSIVDFDFSEAKGTDVGTYKIHLTGKNIYAGQTAEIPFKIVPLRITDVQPESVSVENKKFMYTATLGKKHDGTMNTKAALTLKYKISANNIVTLEEGRDYTYTTDTNEEKVVVTGKGNFTTVDPQNKKVTTTKLSYTKNQNGLDLNDPSITVTVNGTYNYTGYPITPSIDKLTVVESGTPPYTLQKGVDFSIKEYGDNTDAGEGTIVIQGGSNGVYSGERTVTFKITGSAIDETYKIADIKDIMLEDILFNDVDGKVDPRVIRKDNNATAPNSVWDSTDVKYYRNGKLMTNRDFYKAGPVEVVVSGKGQYEGTLKATYNILGIDIAKVASVAAIDDQNYTGKEIEPEVTVISNWEYDGSNNTLVKDKDYTVSYANNIMSGTAYATVKGIGRFSGEIVKSFKIVGQMEQNFEFLAAQVRDIKNRTLASNATVVKYEKGKEPKTDVTYSSSDEKVFTVDDKTGAIAYTGVGTATLTASAVESDIYKAETKTMTIRVVPRTPGNPKVTSAAGRKLTITADEVPEAEMYQIRIRKKGHSSLFIKFANIGELRKVYTTKSNGEFEIWVRAYTTIGEEDHHFSEWSKMMTATAKK